jgi:hypothetical protein
MESTSYSVLFGSTVCPEMGVLSGSSGTTSVAGSQEHTAQ